MDLYYKRTEFPVQKLPLKMKDESWRRGCVDVLVSREGSTYASGRSRRDILRTNYDLYNGIFNEDDFKYVVNPYNVEDGFPAHPQSMNIIKSKIDLLIGEETKRPFNIKVFSTNEEAISQVQEVKMNMLVQEYISSTLEGQPEEVIDKKLQEIDAYIKNKYSSVAEKTAYDSLQYLRQQLLLEHEFIKGWKDGLIAGEEIYYTGIVNGEPMCERVNPYHFTYDNDPDIEYIEDGDWAVRRFLMAPGAIYDRFQNVMDEEDLDNLLKMVGGDSLRRRPSDVNFNTIIYKDKIISDITNDEFFKGQLIPVWHTVWKSFKKIFYIVDGEGNDLDVVDEFFKLSDEEKAMGLTLQKDWITETWEGFRIGTDIYLEIRPVEYQYQSLENPKTSKLPYVGAKYNCTNTKNRSLVDTMKSLQYMYIVVWYRLELALARDKGKIITMDITQIPKSMGIDVKQWMHYLSALGVNLVNPHEEGWDIPGRAGGHAAAFNNFGQADLTMSKVIADYIGLLDKIEEMCGELSGVSRQRQGSIASNELVGNVQRSVVQSSHITEPLFEIHNQVKRRTYTALLNCAKYAWTENKRKKLNFIVDDFSRTFLNIDDDFLYSDFDVFVNDSTRENQNLEALKGLIQPAMQNGATLSDAALILTTESISEVRNKLQEIEERRLQQTQAMEQQQQQLQAMQAQMEQEALAEDRRIKEEDSIRKSETAIQVALIGASSNERSDGDNEPEDTGLEAQKLGLQTRKIESDTRLKQAQINEVVRSNMVSERQKEKEISIKQKVANRPVAKSTK
jgi:hypothetical protein